MSGDFTPSLKFIYYFIESLSKSDLNNPNYQLIIAIQFLTINDQFKREMD